MLPPNNMLIRQLSQQESISGATLHKWRVEARGKGQLLPAADAGAEGWSSRGRFAAVLERGLMPESAESYALMSVFGIHDMRNYPVNTRSSKM